MLVFDLEFDLSTYLAKEVTQLSNITYSLMAFVGHCGSIDEGHYITCFRSGKFNNHTLHSKVKDDKIWVKYDDEAACYMIWDETQQFFCFKGHCIHSICHVLRKRGVK